MKRLLLLLMPLFLLSPLSHGLEYNQDGIKFNYKYYSYGVDIWDVEIAKSGHVEFPQSVNGESINEVRNYVNAPNATSIDFGEILCTFYSITAPNLVKLRCNLSGWCNGEGLTKLELLEVPTKENFGLWGVKSDFKVIAPHAKNIDLRNCTGLTSFAHTTVEELCLNGCENLSVISCPSVKILQSTDCPNLETIDCMNVENLNITNCSKLNSFTGDNVTFLRSAKNCISLKEISFPKLEKVEARAFQGCTALEKVNLPSAIFIGDYAFADCTSLTDITLSETIESFTKATFINCTSLKSMSLPNLKVLTEECFKGCTALTSLDIPKCELIKANCLNGTHALRKLELPALATIETWGFSNSGIEEFNHSGPIDIKRTPFSDCPNLKKVSITTDLNNWRFTYVQNCPVLETLELGVAKLGGNPFLQVPSLKTLKLDKVTQFVRGDINQFKRELPNVPNLETVSLNSMQGFDAGMLSKWPMRVLVAEKAENISGNNCPNLKKVYAPNAKMIVGYGFDGSAKLEEVYAPNLETVGEFAFRNCASLKEFRGLNVKSIGRYAFEKCQGLKNVELGDSVQAIPNNCFRDCSGLETFSGPQVKILENSAFINCESLKNLNVPKLQRIEESALYETKSLERVQFNSLTHLRRWALNKTYFTEFVSGDSIVNIEDTPFKDCPNLRGIKMPNVKSVNILATNCPVLETISLGVETLNCFPTTGVTTLKTLYFDKVKNFGDEWNKNKSQPQANAGLQTVSCGALEKLNPRNFESWPMRELKLPNVDTISSAVIEAVTWVAIRYGNSPLGDCANLETLFIPKARIIGDEAIRNCGRLKTVEASSLESIGRQTFIGCSSLAEINAPNLQSTAYGAFKNCSSLAEINFPKLETIADCTFENAGLVTAILPSVSSLGQQSFLNCSKLAELEVPKLQNIGPRAFEKCIALSRVDLPGIATIGDYAFVDCTKLESVLFGDMSERGGEENGQKVKVMAEDETKAEWQLGLKVFQNCNNLASIRIAQIENTPALGCTATTFQDNHYASVSLEVPEWCYEDYAAHEIWTKFMLSKTLELYPYKTAFYDYTTYDMTVKGVTADGATQLFITTAAGLPLENCVAKASVEFEDQSFAGTVSEYKLLANGKKGFVFTAPNGFPADFDKSHFRILLQVFENADATETYASTNIDVYRPGVLLLHGLFSNKSAWQSFPKYLKGKHSYESWQIYQGDYSPSNSASFVDNAEYNAVVEQNLLRLSKSMRDHGIASSKYDLVGHSMGGILSRLYAQGVNKFSDKDKVNRIITVNTPHFGSDGAIFLQWSAGTLSQLFPINASLDLLQTFLKNPALINLGTDSKGIRYLNNTIAGGAETPIHTISSYLDTPIDYSHVDFCELTQGWGVLPLGVVCSLKSTPSRMFDFYKWLFNGENDGVVQIESQGGGLPMQNRTILSDPYYGALGMKSKAHHCNITDWDNVHEILEKLLLEPVGSQKFGTIGMMKKSETAPKRKAVSSSDGSEYKISETAHIKIECNEDMSFGENHYRVNLTSNDEVIDNVCFAFVDDEQMVLGSSRDEYIFNIPPKNEETPIFVIGKTATGEICIDECMVKTRSQPDVIALEWNSYETPEVTVGQTLDEIVYGIWADGTKDIVNASFETENTKIAKVEEGKITGMAPGNCTLTAHFNGLSISKDIEVKKQSLLLPVSIALDCTFKELDIEDIFTLKAEITVPVEDEKPIVQWTSSDENIASVSQEGIVSAKSAGTCFISVTTANGLSAQCEIEVRKPLGVDEVFDEVLADGDAFDVWTLDGIPVKTMTTKAELKKLPPGLYIVSCKGQNLKIIVN